MKTLLYKHLIEYAKSLGHVDLTDVLVPIKRRIESMNEKDYWCYVAYKYMRDPRIILKFILSNWKEGLCLNEKLPITSIYVDLNSIDIQSMLLKIDDNLKTKPFKLDAPSHAIFAACPDIKSFGITLADEIDKRKKK